MAPKKRARRQEVDLDLALLPQGSPAKKLKSQHDSSTNIRDPRRQQPGFWDRLSKIELTTDSLGELDRRTNAIVCNVEAVGIILSQTKGSMKPWLGT